jgi:hypothetical protein
MLAACECSGRVRDAFARRGWEAWSADLLPSETPVSLSVISANMLAEGQHSPLSREIPVQGFTGHFLGDVRELFGPQEHWDLIIGFPPCTHLSLAGARYWREKQADGRQQAAAEFFMEMIQAPARFVAVENPRGRMTQLYQPPTQIVEPWWFGDPYAKKTCLWLRDLPELFEDDPVPAIGRVATGGGSWRVDKEAGRAAMSAYEDSEGRKNRDKVRSRTFLGVARAMADQWGPHIENAIRIEESEG